MLASAALLFFIETTIAIEKTKALAFASSVLFIGLSARAIAKRQRLAMEAAPPVAAAPAPAVSAVQRPEAIPFTSRMLVAVRGGGERLLRQACEDAKRQHAFLFVLNIKQVSVAGILPEKMPAESFVDNQWMDTICREYTIPFKVISILSPEIGYTIAEQAATLGVDRVVLGSTQRSLVEQALRGDVIRSVSELLPEEIQLSIYRA